MSGKIIYTPQAPHECRGKPVARGYRAGTLWQCDECNQKWVVVEGAQYNEYWKAWRKLTARNIGGEDK